MARTVLFALLGAFILSLTLVPVLTSFFLSGKRAGHDTWLMRKAHRAYAPLLRRVLARPSITLAVGLVVLALGGGLLTRLGAEFVPQLDEGDLLLEVRRLPGIALTETIATDQRIARALLAIREVEHVVPRAGAPGGRDRSHGHRAERRLHHPETAGRVALRSHQGGARPGDRGGGGARGARGRLRGVAADPDAHQRAHRRHPLRRGGADLRPRPRRSCGSPGSRWWLP